MTKAYFNGQADIWDEKIAEKDGCKLESISACLTIEPGATILDVGTGTGVLLPYLLAKAGAEGKLIALDHADKMLAKAKAKNRHVNIRYICADIMSVPLADEIGDAVVCYSSLPHFPDKPQALLEIKRVLKKADNSSSAIPPAGNTSTGSTGGSPRCKTTCCRTRSK